MPFSNMRDVIESSTTRIDRASASAGFAPAAVRATTPGVFLADLSRSSTLRMGTTRPDPSTVAPAMLRTRESGLPSGLTSTSCSSSTASTANATR